MSDGAAGLVARALHAQADNSEREAHREEALTGPGTPLTRKDVLAMLADHDRQLAAGISCRISGESDLTGGT